ncbi:MAG: alanine racemase [Firmicutes bacterium HGW-Firmicutes-11]|jgi:alanine racemase|nr:MAG: alanine racemase [Firmicutes bacterium HGW-Firmicutes-11]
MDKTTLRPVWAEIDLTCIDHNIKAIRDMVGETEIFGVVKADGYGHGAVEVSRVLLKNGVSTLAVATLSEAIALRNAGFTCPIVMLGLTPGIYHEEILRYDITPVLASYMDTRVLSSLAVEARKTVEILIAVETGMGRVGFLQGKDSITEILGIQSLPNIKIKGIFSHFATADEADKTYAKQQLASFHRFRKELETAGVRVDFLTHANSAGLLELPESRLDAVRPGIILYGCYPSAEVDRNLIDLRPAMSLKANIVFLKKVPPGFSVSYGRKFVTERESMIATLPLGYADGYPRFLSGKGRVLVHGQYAPVVGNICMDQCMIDVTDIPHVRKYDEVVLIGAQGENRILADEIAEKTGTINYEIVCRIGQRVPRVYLR